MRLIQFPSIPPCEVWAREQLGRSTVLDLGCGIAPALWLNFEPEGYLGVDAFEPYIENVRLKCPHLKFEQHDLRAPLPFADRSYDVVVLSDVIEHFDVGTAEKVLLEAFRVSKRGVLLRTPDGYIEQEGDAWGMGGDEFQRHRSGWTASDFPGADWCLVAENAVKVKHLAGQSVPLDPPRDFLTLWLPSDEVSHAA